MQSEPLNKSLSEVEGGAVFSLGFLYLLYLSVLALAGSEARCLQSLRNRRKAAFL